MLASIARRNLPIPIGKIGLRVAGGRPDHSPHIRDAVISREPEQVLVSGYDKFGARRDCAFKDSVVGRILLDDVDLHCWPYRPGHAAIRLRASAISSGVKSNLRASASAISSKIASDTARLILPSRASFKKLKGLSSPEIDAGDQDVGIGCDAQQSAPIFLAHLGNEPVNVVFADALCPRPHLVALDILPPTLFLKVFRNRFCDYFRGLAVLCTSGFFHSMQKLIREQSFRIRHWSLGFIFSRCSKYGKPLLTDKACILRLSASPTESPAGNSETFRRCQCAGDADHSVPQGKGWAAQCGHRQCGQGVRVRFLYVLDVRVVFRQRRRSRCGAA
jgi:hypothetical protein